jgi:hypothetical protein
MNFLQNYTHDVFVSYAHGPEAQSRYHGERHNLLTDWTHCFVDDLTAQIDISLSQVGFDGQERPSVAFFMDNDLKGSGSLTGNIKAAVQESALLLVVMSPLYLQSKWCTDEIDWFLAAGADDNPELHRFNRTFVVRAFPTEHRQWPNGLKDEIGKATYGHFFHPKKARQGDTVPFGWPLPDKRVRDYWTEIVRLATDITSKLRRLKELEQKSPEGAAATTVEPAIGRRVMLGYTHDTLIPIRKELRHELTKVGLQVLPPENDDAWDEPSLRERLKTYLDQAHVVALCANQYCGTWPRDQNGGFISLQMQAARERKIPCQLWLTWDQATEPQTPEYKQFLDDLVRESESSELNIKINYASAKEFAEHIKTTVNEESIASTGVEQLAVVCSNLRSNVDTYQRFYQTVMTAIGETDRLSILPTFDNATGHIRLEEIEKDINRADTIVVICFDQEWRWATNIMGQIRQLIKADAAKRARLLIIGPPARDGFEVNASAFRFTTLNANAIDEQQLREFLKEALAASRERGKESPAQTVN